MFYLEDDKKKKGKKRRRYAEKKRLKRFFQRRCMSYSRLSELLNISVDALNNKLNGYTSFTSNDVAKIVIYFDLTADEVIEFFLNEDRGRMIAILGQSVSYATPQEPPALKQDIVPF